MPYEINDRALSWAPPESIEPEAIAQIEQTSQMPFIHRYVAGHARLSLWPRRHRRQLHTHDRSNHSCRRCVDIGCGMTAVQTNYAKADLPED